MKKGFNFILDILLWVILLLEFPFKKSGNNSYIYQRDFLGKDDYAKDLKEIFEPVTAIASDDLEKIYSIKETLYSEVALSKLKYCIENKFWGIFAFTSSDGDWIEDNCYFSQPSIRVYLLLDSTSRKKIVIVKSTVKHFELLYSYPDLNSWMICFKDRKIVFSKSEGFVSI
jgi:hypothetical protein